MRRNSMKWRPALAGHSEPIICDPRHNDSVRQSTANCIGCERGS